MESTATFTWLGMTFDTTIVLSTLLTVVIVSVLVIALTRRVAMRPGKAQNFVEYVLDFTNGILKGILPREDARKFGLFAFTLFIFIVASNELGLIFSVSGHEDVWVKSPTASYWTTGTLAAMSLLIAHVFGMRKLGVGPYAKNLLFAPAAFMAPLNIIEQVAQFLTLTLRLFGNIFAGEVLLELLSNQLATTHGHFNQWWQVLLALPLSMAWQAFSLFIGVLQAYVFVTLVHTYARELSHQE